MELFAGFKIRGINIHTVPASYYPNRVTPLTIYLDIDPVYKDDPAGHRYRYLRNVWNESLEELWVDKFNESADAWFQENADLQDMRPKIEHKGARTNCLRVQDITLEQIEWIVEPLKKLISQINRQIGYEITRRGGFQGACEPYKFCTF